MRLARGLPVLLLLVFASTPVRAAADPAFEQIDAFIEQARVVKGSSVWKTRLAKPPQLTFSPDKTYFWLLETEVGLLRVRLRPDAAPMHVSSLIYLTRLGFYDGTFFHRVIPGFMAQGGDPTGTGRSGPGYTLDGEFEARLRHDKAGVLSAANAGPGTDGSQFFLTFGPAPHLNGKHTVYGELSGGRSALDRLAEVGSAKGTPSRRIHIERATAIAR